MEHQAAAWDQRAAVRYLAMWRAFGLEEPSSDDVEHRSDGLGHLFADTTRAYAAVRSPFDGALEAPPAFNRMAGHHGAHVHDAAVRLREVLLDLGTDVALALWALPSGMRVTDEDLLLHGYDPRDFPDDDDW